MLWKVPQNNAIVYHNIAHGGVLRIDPPPPPKKKVVKKPVAKPKPKPVVKKPVKKVLSRLEQLRLQKKEEQEGK